MASVLNAGYRGNGSSYRPSGSGWSNFSNYLKKANKKALQGLDAAPDFTGGIDLGPTEEDWYATHTKTIPGTPAEPNTQKQEDNPDWLRWEEIRKTYEGGGPLVYKDFWKKYPEPPRYINTGSPGSDGTPDTQMVIPYKPWGDEAKITNTYDTFAKNPTQQSRNFDNAIFRSNNPDWSQVKPQDTWQDSDWVNKDYVHNNPSTGYPDPEIPMPNDTKTTPVQVLPGPSGTGTNTGKNPNKPGYDENVDEMVAQTRLRAFPGVRW